MRRNRASCSARRSAAPAMSWTNVPAGTRSFVLHFHDPDVSINKTTNDQVHWLVWGIPGTATGLSEGQPQGELYRESIDFIFTHNA